MPHDESLKRNIVFLYNPLYTHILTLRTYVEAFGQYSKHNIDYLPAGDHLQCHFDLSGYDALVIHYSLRVCFPESGATLSSSFEKAIAALNIPKFLFIQDEYDCTNRAIDSMNRLGIGVVFTCVPEEYITKVYPPEKLPNTKFISVLTGYVPEILTRSAEKFSKPLEERDNWLIYRGRSLPYIYGALGREKYDIGIQMRRHCKELGIPHDINVEEYSRIYGHDWYRFLGNSRAMLSTESGSNLFDFDGNLRAQLDAIYRKNPRIRYEDVYPTILAPHDNFIKMNQMSPKIFEAIALNTGLVLFEGHYSGVVKADIHFIPLKKDCSNVNDVVEKLGDMEYLKQMIDRAYHDVIDTGKYSYQAFVSMFDGVVNQNCLSQRQDGSLGVCFTRDVLSDAQFCKNKTIDPKYWPSRFLFDVDIFNPEMNIKDITVVRRKLRKYFASFRTLPIVLMLAGLLKCKCPGLYLKIMSIYSRFTRRFV